MFWKESFLNKMRQKWADEISVFQYKSNGIWKSANINGKTIEGNTIRLLVQVMETESFTITGMRIVDSAGIVIGETSENIVKPAGNQMISEWVFPVYEI